MGGGSSSSNAQQDMRNTVGPGGIGISGSGSSAVINTTNNITDGGAVKASLDAAIKAQQLALNSSDKTTAAAFKFAGSSQQVAYASMEQALGAVAKAYEGAKGNADSSAKTAQFAIVGAAAVAVGALLLKS